jgi:anti-sigma B factor antagonist
MQVNLKTQNNILIIKVNGSIDSNTAPEIQEKVLEASADSKNVIIDLSEVDFVSSAGLRVILMIYRQIKSKDGKVVLVGVSEEIEDVMTVTGFANFFEMVDTVENALKLY